MSSRVPSSFSFPTTKDAANKATLLRPITLVFFVVLLAGQFSFERIGMTNPLLIPERLFAMILVTLVAGIVAFANIRRDSPAASSALIVSLPLLYALMTAAWGPNLPDEWEAVIDLICMLLACLTAAMLLRWNRAVVAETFLWCAAVTGIVYSLAGLASSSAGERAAAFGGGPNVFSRITMMGLLAIVGLVIIRKLPRFALIVTPLMVVATIISGSRGGMLAGLASICVLAPLLKRLRPMQIFAGLALLTACMVLVYRNFADSVDQIIDGRIIVLTLNEGYTSGRGNLLRAARDLFEQNFFFGAGLRGFEDYYGNGFTYPHNLIMQTAAEGGAFGLIILLGSLTILLKRVVPQSSNPISVVFLAMASIIFVSSMFSGDYYDSRFLWIFLLLAINAPTPSLDENDMNQANLRTGTS
ncbi:MAG: O-antigen ligase family protein [Kineosporiaceae bacterium]|nr:O-antigen ligase family protein [Aeromicrobium sp.]